MAFDLALAVCRLTNFVREFDNRELSNELQEELTRLDSAVASEAKRAGMKIPAFRPSAPCKPYCKPYGATHVPNYVTSSGAVYFVASHEWLERMGAFQNQAGDAPEPTGEPKRRPGRTKLADDEVAHRIDLAEKWEESKGLMRIPEFAQQHGRNSKEKTPEVMKGMIRYGREYNGR